MTGEMLRTVQDPQARDSMMFEFEGDDVPMKRRSP